MLKDVVTCEPVFQYKYLVVNNGQPERWEVGVNRIADLPLLEAESGDMVLQD